MGRLATSIKCAVLVLPLIASNAEGRTTCPLDAETISAVADGAKHWPCRRTDFDICSAEIAYPSDLGYVLGRVADARNGMRPPVKACFEEIINQVGKNLSLRQYIWFETGLNVGRSGRDVDDLPFDSGRINAFDPSPIIRAVDEAVLSAEKTRPGGAETDALAHLHKHARMLVGRWRLAGQHKDGKTVTVIKQTDVIFEYRADGRFVFISNETTFSGTWTYDANAQKILTLVGGESYGDILRYIDGNELILVDERGVDLSFHRQQTSR